ncbi:carboxymuconolactone decarboxylase family protein [Kiritimatiellota bacterium B12222]|nr:carboxymuconolactone decarboxylase family protein [Kiritimatiellota bacterium B12222]
MSRVSAKKKNEYPWSLRLMYWNQYRTRGQTLLPTQVWGRSPVLLWRFLRMFQAFERNSSPLDPVLRALITVRVSQINHCAFCIDFNAMRVLAQGGAEDKLDGLADIANSVHFSEAEKAALIYAETITDSQRRVSDEQIEALKKDFSEDEIVELTALIAFQNMSSKFNAALDLPAQGFCEWKPMDDGLEE